MSIKTLLSLESAVVLLTFFINFTICIEIVSRKTWGGRPAKSKEIIPEKLSHVIIHHSAVPAACFVPDDCQKAMRSMQDFHQNDRGWEDIGYSFGIGGDGKIYEGRGFNIVGAHAPGYNNKSVGICLIGDWTAQTPSSAMLQATKKLIDYGVGKGHLKSDYILHGHRQVKPTECPGNALFGEIKTWPQFRDALN